MLMHQLLIDGAERSPDRLAFHWVDRDVTLSYADAVEAMENMAGALASIGVRPGERVAIFAHNGMDYLVALFGIWRIGAISALVNVQFAAELDYYFADHTPSIVIYTHDMASAVRRAAASAGGVRHLICMDGPQDGALSLPELMAARLPPPADPWDESSIAHLAYTSGTTGKPKGACLAHEPTVRAARCIAERLRVTRTDESFGPTALSSSYQLVGNILPPLSRGAGVHVMGKWNQTAGWDALERTGSSLFIANPTLLGQVLLESRIRGRHLARLRAALSGGGPVPPTLKQAWRDELQLPLVESFGQSELGGFMALGFPELVADDALLPRVGPALPDKEVRIVDAARRPVAVGVVGEIELRGGFMHSYWNQPGKTAEAIGTGWLRTGDLGLIDRDGFVTMRGRRSELIEIDGVLWFPRDVEEAFCQIPGVAQAALIGVPDAEHGQRPLAFITLIEGHAADASHLKTAIVGKVSHDLTPLHVTIVAELPMTPTGKIAKGELAARWSGETVMRDWWDLTTGDFAKLNFSQAVVLLPVAAIEQHGPHLPVRVDAAINAGIIEAARALVPDDLDVLILPAQHVGKSNEHLAFPGTLSIGYETLGRLWFDLVESAYRAGCRRVLFFNSHGGQPQLVDIVCRELRVRLNMFAVNCAWYNLVDMHDLFDAEELRHGIHGGAVETSIMLHLHPDLVKMTEAVNFTNAAQAIERENRVLRVEGAVGFGWQTQDLNPHGACGDATQADARSGALLVERAARALTTLIGEVARYPLPFPPA